MTDSASSGAAPSFPSLPDSSAADSSSQLSREERELLLQLAHDAIVSALEGRQISLEPPTPRLAEPRGVFTSLYLNGELRGCVGYVLPIGPLYRAVAESARAAAFDDSRFSPVTMDEAPQICVEISVLSRLQPIAPEGIEIGRHGLLIGWHGHRGLLLPQVAVEHGWDRITFLEQTCRKAGLPVNAWRDGAKVEGFTAEVFGEKKADA